MTAWITTGEYLRFTPKYDRNSRLIKLLATQVKTSLAGIGGKATADKLNQDCHDKYLDRRQFLDHLCKSPAPHTTVAQVNCSVSVLLILAAHPLFKYSRSELGEGGRFYLQVFVMAKSNESTSLLDRHFGVDPPAGRPGKRVVYPGQIAIWLTSRCLRNLKSCDHHNFTNTDSPAKRLSKSMLPRATSNADSFLLQIREYFA